MILCGFILPVFILYPMYEEQSDLFYGSYTDNFVIRWGFQFGCQHCFDPRIKLFPTKRNKITTFNPESVNPGDIIFVRNVDKFIKGMHPLIKNPYIMVTAGDYKDAVKPRHMAFLNNINIIAWYSVHPCWRLHAKFHPIPLGIFQNKKNYLRRRNLTQYFSKLRHTPKEKLLYMNFGFRRKFKPKRNLVHRLFANAPFCTKSGRVPFGKYMNDMSQHKFTLAPRGVGPDTYRAWEAMLVGSIPIVQSSQLNSLYADLPVLIVQKWEDITPEFLEQKYAEICSKKFNIEKLFMEYWWKKIKDEQQKFFLR